MPYEIICDSLQLKHEPVVSNIESKQSYISLGNMDFGGSDSLVLSHY